jgi:hypothetical protein
MTDRKNPRDNIERVIQKVLRDGQIVIAWYDTPEGLLRAELKIKSLTQNRREIVLNPQPGSFFYLKQLVSGSGAINFYVPQSGLIFCSQVLKFPENGPIVIAFPDQHLFDERREGRRLDCSPINLWIHISDQGKSIRKKCFDLSFGGFSILFAKNESFPWGENDELKQIAIIWNKYKIFFTAKIVKIHNIDPYFLNNYPYGGKRISFKFTKTDKIQKDFLQEFHEHYIGSLKLIDSGNHENK